MGAVKASRPIVKWIVVVLGKIIATDDSVVFAKPASKGEVIKSDPGVNHGDRLPSPVETILSGQVAGSSPSVLK